MNTHELINFYCDKQSQKAPTEIAELDKTLTRMVNMGLVTEQEKNDYIEDAKKKVVKHNGIRILL